MNDFLKWGLVGIGAYLLYQQYVETPPLVSGGPQPAGGSGGSGAGGTGSGSTPPPQTQPPLSTGQTAALVDLARLQQFAPATLASTAAAGMYGGMVIPSGGLTTPSVWNWYMTRLTGVKEPNLANFGVGDSPVTAAQYWNALMAWATAAAHSANGLAGVENTSQLPVTFDMNALAW